MQEVKAIDSISTGELIDELLKRCAPACFIGTKNEGGQGWQSFYNVKGDAAACYGLLHELAFNIQMRSIENMMGDYDA